MKRLNPPITDWVGKRVWIVGASSGIGAALARRLQQAGARLALTARREEALREVAVADALIAPADVTDAAALHRTCELVQERLGGIDVVVYCAGVYTPMRAWELDLPAVRETLEINLLGVYNLLESLLPVYLAAGAGSLCLVSSVAGYTGLPKALAYGPGKAALINLAQTLYTDLSPLGIGVYLINPGFVATRLTRKNDFRMPALISPDAAATAIIAGLGRGDFEIRFPRGFTGGMKRLGRLPDRLRFYLIGKLVET